VVSPPELREANKRIRLLKLREPRRDDHPRSGPAPATSVRHHALPVRADHNPTYRLATLTSKAPLHLVISRLRNTEFPKQDRHFRVLALRAGRLHVKRGG
jgi:hypothetical protein